MTRIGDALVYVREKVYSQFDQLVATLKQLQKKDLTPTSASAKALKEKAVAILTDLDKGFTATILNLRKEPDKSKVLTQSIALFQSYHGKIKYHLEMVERINLEDPQLKIRSSSLYKKVDMILLGIYDIQENLPSIENELMKLIK
ncbi:MAG: hypothetical protein Q7S55_02905 [Nanoarchaeota archaeon]|nr:hypothetical protein [Nanoarchaeota archaeon]